MSCKRVVVGSIAGEVFHARRQDKFDIVRILATGNDHILCDGRGCCDIPRSSRTRPPIIYLHIKRAFKQDV